MAVQQELENQFCLKCRKEINQLLKKTAAISLARNNTFLRITKSVILPENTTDLQCYKWSGMANRAYTTKLQLNRTWWGLHICGDQKLWRVGNSSIQMGLFVGALNCNQQVKVTVQQNGPCPVKGILVLVPTTGANTADSPL